MSLNYHKVKEGSEEPTESAYGDKTETLSFISIHGQPRICAAGALSLYGRISREYIEESIRQTTATRGPFAHRLGLDRTAR